VVRRFVCNAAVRHTEPPEPTSVAWPIGMAGERPRAAFGGNPRDDASSLPSANHAGWSARPDLFALRSAPDPCRKTTSPLGLGPRCVAWFW